MAESDKSNGYDANASEFAQSRSATIGVAEVRAWARTLPKPATVLDLGCGTGTPIGEALVREGVTVYGIDASPRMIDAFKQRLPEAHAACEAVEDSRLFDRTFDGIVAWGLMFVLPLDAQRSVIVKAARALNDNGTFLFTSPRQACTWADSLTGRTSISPGADEYRRWLEAAGLTLERELTDEGDNHYYVAVKRPA